MSNYMVINVCEGMWGAGGAGVLNANYREWNVNFQKFLLVGGVRRLDILTRIIINGTLIFH